jgi:hypothetical protein
MKRFLLSFCILVAAALIFLNLLAGWAILPPMLLDAPLPARTEAERSALRTGLCPPGCSWTSETLTGGESRPLTVWRLHRPASRGIAVLLHGFGDDAWGGVSRLKDLPELDAVTFRNVRGVNFQPVAWFGRLPGGTNTRDRATLTGILQGLEAQTKGQILLADFVPLPCHVDRVAVSRPGKS